MFLMDKENVYVVSMQRCGMINQDVNSIIRVNVQDLLNGRFIVSAYKSLS